MSATPLDRVPQAPLIHIFPGARQSGAGLAVSNAAALGGLLIAEAALAAGADTVALGPFAFDCGATIPATTGKFLGAGVQTTVTINQTLASLAAFIGRCAGLTVIANNGTATINASGIQITTVGASLMSAASQAAARAAIGAGTASTAADVGLANVTNDAQVKRTEMGAASGVATLDGAGKLPTAQLPDLAVSDYLGAAANQAAMLALTGQKGDWCNRTDTGTVFIITGNTPSQLSSWTQLNYPTAPVTSVAGKTGAVTLVKGDVGLGNVDNTSDANKPVSTAMQSALNAKMDFSSVLDDFASLNDTNALVIFGSGGNPDTLQYSGDAAQFLDGTGAWTTPSGGGWGRMAVDLDNNSGVIDIAGYTGNRDLIAYVQGASAIDTIMSSGDSPIDGMIIYLRRNRVDGGTPSGVTSSGNIALIGLSSYFDIFGSNGQLALQWDELDNKWIELSHKPYDS